MTWRSYRSRDGRRLASRPVQPKGQQVVIIDGTERRQQRPKTPEKQALYYSGKKKTHTDKNVLVAGQGADGQLLFLSGTYPGKTHDKRIADEEQLTYPPGTILYKDTAFQGYEPPVQQTCQAKSRQRGGELSRRGETGQPQASRLWLRVQRGARHRWCEAEPDCQRHLSEQETGVVR